MDKQVKEFLEKIDKVKLEKNAYFGIRQYGGGSDESYIFANKDGLLRFSFNLLESYLKIDDVLKNTSNTNIPLPIEEDWIDDLSDTYIEYIRPTNLKKNELKEAEDEIDSSWKDKIVGFFIAGLVLGFFGLSILGLITVIRWLI